MINVTALSSTAPPDDLTAIGVPVHSAIDGPAVAGDLASLTEVNLPTTLDADWCEQQGFGGKITQTLVIRSLDGGPSVVLVGLGAADKLEGDAGLESLRRAVASFVRATGKSGTAVLALPVVKGVAVADVAAAAAEGGSLATYSYDDFRSSDASTGLTGLMLTDGSGDVAGVAEGAARGTRVSRSVGLARDLVNEPASSCGCRNRDHPATH